MKKKVISTVLCAAMVASMFAGCGNKAANNSTADNSAAESSDAAATTEAGDAAAETEAASASDDAIANLIASTDGTVDIQLWCSELEAYERADRQI